jgi:eukaryotic-like serine/threonine-protein kinase
VRDEARLGDLAAALAEGSDVDWEQAEQHSADGQERSLIRELRLIARIADLAQLAPPETPSVPAARSSDVPQIWCHLRLIEQIGKGSFGTVYRAWDTNLECEVALKLIPASPESAARGISRALKEARLLARVRHRHVVTVHGADSHEGVFGLWMDLITGRTLEEVLTFHGPMGAQETSHIGVDLCSALAAVHRAGLLHRDIKATNVMREDGGRVVLMDFGAGRHIDPGDDSSMALVGTPLYLAPELFRGGPPSIPSDIYSLGVLLYHLVTGRYPTAAKVPADVERAHAQGTRELLRDARPDLPTAFASVIERALSPRPDDRFQSAGAFGEAIAATSGIHHGEGSSKFNWRQRWVMSLGVAVASIAVAVLGLTLLGSRQAASENIPASAAALRPASNVPIVEAADTYQVAADFFASRNGSSERLAADSRVAPGDKIFMTLELSKPAYAYVINQDDKGEAYVLFPLPGQKLTNPLPAGEPNRLPSGLDHEDAWQVTSAGGREHFLVFVAPERLTAFEQVLAALPRAEAGRPVVSAQLPRETLGNIRGVGGLAATSQASSSTDSPLQSLSPLGTQGETAKGLWARQITFQNPAK